MSCLRSLAFSQFQVSYASPIKVTFCICQDKVLVSLSDLNISRVEVGILPEASYDISWSILKLDGDLIVEPFNVLGGLVGINSKSRS
ncbi:hypothetical protein VNO77_44178 [Canavalia gladiata]|uniref:Uncharacterized protein n=1 Tax=Canavalia gladiata TaxID=3824 RepID=A0AAN9JW78_CANGL